MSMRSKIDLGNWGFQVGIMRKAVKKTAHSIKARHATLWMDEFENEVNLLDFSPCAIR